ncbi:MAG: polysaccharide deacetylase family protein [Gammaproteobacteria bacterium]|nr:polysaccharide deacetylase family protein [Gammaproteobacteria bacterium]
MTAGALFRRLGRSTARLARTRYPAFLFGGALPRDEIPVFTYHDVEPDVLHGDLEFLRRNGYRTVGIDEFRDRSARGVPNRDRCVMLTFDDARGSFHTVAWPVLREREAHAVLFVPSYWIGGGRGAPAGEDAGADAARADAAAKPGFMTWEQLAECEASEWVDVESHGHCHALVPVSSRLAGFASPAALEHYDLFDWPMRRERGVDVPGRPPPGTPVYESAPLLSAEVRVIEPAAAAEACRRLVEREGGAAAFFRRPDAEGALRASHDAAVAAGGGAEPMPPAEVRRGIEDELRRAAERFEAELGRPPRHFAYPWMLGGERSLDVLAELGVETAFGVALDFRRARRTRRHRPRIYGRFKCDWLRFLPGQGRRSLQHVLPAKAAGFLKTQHLAH